MTKQTLTNITYDELTVGQLSTLVHTVKEQDIMLFGYMSGDVNPAHFDREYAKNTMFKDVIIQGMWTGSLISAVLGTQLPGPGTIYLEQSLKFTKPVYIGDTITITISVLEKQAKNRVVLDCKCTNQNEQVVTLGTATVIAPQTKVSVIRPQLKCIEVTSA